MNLKYSLIEKNSSNEKVQMTKKIFQMNSSNDKIIF